MCFAYLLSKPVAERRMKQVIRRTPPPLHSFNKDSKQHIDLLSNLNIDIAMCTYYLSFFVIRTEKMKKREQTLPVLDNRSVSWTIASHVAWDDASSEELSEDYNCT